MKGGIGSAAIALPNGLIVAALVVVNAAGDVIDPANGQVVAGVRTADGKALADARKILRAGGAGTAAARQNTTLGVVATNARLTKTEATRVSQMAHDGFARALAPSHTPGDGDVDLHAGHRGHRSHGRRGVRRRTGRRAGRRGRGRCDRPGRASGHRRHRNSRRPRSEVNLHLVVLLSYALALMALGLWIGRRVRGAGDFFVAGRRLGPGLLFSTMLAANIGAGSTVGAAGLGYSERHRGVVVGRFGRDRFGRPRPVDRARDAA